MVELSREALGDEMSASEQAGLARLEAAVQPVVPRPRLSPWLWAVLPAGAAVALAVVLGPGAIRRHGNAITYQVEGGTVSDTGYIRETGAGPVAVHFSEGTELQLSKGSRARLAGVDAQGARVLIENGAARVHVTPRPRARWSVDAGPYNVRVTGTAFDVAWSGGEEVLDLSLHHGSVVVTGPLAAQGLVLEAGQHLRASVKAGVIRLDRDGAAGTAAPPSGAAEGAGETTTAEADERPPAPADVAAEPGRRRAPAPKRAPAPAVRAEPAVAWPARIARGEFRAVLTEAEARGIDETLRTASVEDLAALADAARYARRTELAEQTLLSERRRYPQSVAGRDAAFFLGGLREEVPGSGPAGAAIGWYDRYLTENPNGTYVAQALGRKMMLAERVGERQSARAVATEYLRRFPAGPHADRARTLLERAP
jgi:hypothetical protein